MDQACRIKEVSGVYRDGEHERAPCRIIHLGDACDTDRVLAQQSVSHASGSLVWFIAPARPRQSGHPEVQSIDDVTYGLFLCGRDIDLLEVEKRVRAFVHREALLHAPEDGWNQQLS